MYDRGGDGYCSQDVTWEVYRDARNVAAEDRIQMFDIRLISIWRPTLN